MSIIIIQGFQVNINEPIDNRFVVGATGYGSDPNQKPFYSNKNLIEYKYCGLRIWDFNDNIPYVWNGNDWISENTTGAVIENVSNPNGTGFKNYLTKFKDNSTILTKGLLYDDSSNVGLGLTGSLIIPNVVFSNIEGTSAKSSTIDPPLSGAYKSGLHVVGNIRTNQYFSGNGKYITDINASNITSGSLNLSRIKAPSGQPGLYIIKNDASGTSWDLASNVIPIPNASNTGTGIGVYNGVSNNTYQFKTLNSLGIDISTDTESITIENKPGYFIGSDTSATKIYRFNTSTKLHEFFSLKSNSLKISQQVDNLGALTGNITIEVPSSGSIDGLYVNMSYIPTYDDWNKGDKDINGFYRGDGTLAKPFTNSIKYDNITMQLLSIIENTSIQNGLDFYINQFGATSGNRKYPAHAYRTLVIQSANTSYRFPGNFNINNLRLKVEEFIISTTTDYLIDMDNSTDSSYSTTTYIFENQSQINIDIDKGKFIEIRGTLDPWNGGDYSQPIPNDGYRATGGRLPGKGFRNSGNNKIPTTYSTGKTLTFNGGGSLVSYYYPSTGVNTPNPLNIFIFNLDSTNGYQGGSPNKTNGNNDGNLCIQVNCGVHIKFQAIYYINGNSKLEFNKSVTSGDLGNTLCDYGSELHNIEIFIHKAGLVRFFNTEISLSNGRRKNAFSFIPDSNFETNCEFVIRNARFSGNTINWFSKKNIGCVDLDITGCTSLYFSSKNLFRTDSNENWNGIDDKRWGSYWWNNPSNTLSPSYGKTFNRSGYIKFNNNTISDININQNCIDLTNSNNLTAVNTIGNSYVEALKRVDYYSLPAIVANAMEYSIFKNSSYLLVESNLSINTTIVGESYEIINCPAALRTSTFWDYVGFNITATTYPDIINPYPASVMGRGIPSGGKSFTCKSVQSVPTGIVICKVTKKVFL